MQFQVVASTAVDASTPPRFLRCRPSRPAGGHGNPAVGPARGGVAFDDAPAEALLGTVTGDPNVAPGVWTKRLWMDPVTENPAVGATEVWELYNATADAHPMHIHEVHFEVVNRQDISWTKPPRPCRSAGTPEDPSHGRPNSRTRSSPTPDKSPGYGSGSTDRASSWHCHIVEHEDNEMMRPYRIGPVQPGQPGVDRRPDHEPPRRRAARRSSRTAFTRRGRPTPSPTPVNATGLMGACQFSQITRTEPSASAVTHGQLAESAQVLLATLAPQALPKLTMRIDWPPCLASDHFGRPAAADHRETVLLRWHMTTRFPRGLSTCGPVSSAGTRSAGSSSV